MTGIDRTSLTVWLLALAWCLTVNAVLAYAAWWLMGLG